MPLSSNQVVGYARTLHIYLTMFAFLLVLFFAVTGFVVHHEDWFTTAEVAPIESRGEIPTALLAQPDRLMIVETLRSRYGAVGAVSAFDVDDATLRVEMKGPGRHTEAEINRKTGALTITVERRALAVRFDDLHRAKDSGPIWGFLLDVSALLLVLGSLTGILMWWALPRRRKLGVASLLAGVVIFVVVYFAVVP